MESVGQKLREARVRLGLTLEQVSADTRITLKNLAAIEADDLSRISSPFFYRSFVKQFAVKVKIDYEAIAAAVQTAASTMPEPRVPGQEELQNIHVAALKAPRPASNFRWLRSVVSFCVVLTACSGAYALWENSHATWNGVLAQVNTTVAAVKTRIASMQPASTRVVAARASQTPNLSNTRAGFHLQLAALERTWLSIVADGKQVFTGELDASQTKALEGHESARIRTGNAGGLSVTFNGKEIGVLGPRGQVRTVVFTKDNYRVLPTTPEIALTAFVAVDRFSTRTERIGLSVPWIWRYCARPGSEEPRVPPLKCP